MAQSPLIAPLVTMNFLHFAVVLFAVSVVLLVGVSLVTAPAPLRQVARPDIRDARVRLHSGERTLAEPVPLAPRLDDRARGVRGGVVGVFRVERGTTKVSGAAESADSFVVRIGSEEHAG